MKIKKIRTYLLILLGILLIVGVFLYSCGQTEGGSGSSGDHNPAVSASNLFDVSGAKAIATASSGTSTSSAIKTMSAARVTELLKLSDDGTISSVFTESLGSTWHPPISVIETGPDGTLYVGFQWGIWISDGGGSSGTGESTSGGGKSVAFFRIFPSGTVESVDEDIYGVGTWYGSDENGELPKKQVQFDSDGNIYYLGTGQSGSTVLKKKLASSGAISQIGSSNMEVRDFLICPNGFVLFHGSNAGSWGTEWLRVMYGSTVSNVFYNSGGGWLRSYYYQVIDSVNYVFLVGENLTLLDSSGVPQNYTGIVKVTLASSGAPSLVEALYDDNNMYSDDWGTIGGQLTWGYWDSVEAANKKFFVSNNYGELIRPLSLEAGVTEAEIRAFIRKKYQSITTDTLSSITFAGQAATIEGWQVSNFLDDLVSANIDGKTWKKWREENNFSTGIRFGNAKQLLFADNGKLYAVMGLDTWGSGSSRGDKLFQIVNASGSAEIVAFPQDTATYYKSMSKARAYGNYVVYLSNKVGQYKIFRLNLNSPTTAPVDMLPSRSNIEIFSFNYNPVSGKLLYDVYDLSDNTSYLTEQALTSTTGAIEISAEGYTITDIVPFDARE